ncbi:MAG: hypothetical protein JWM89_3805, partial [Acidimicrobiales bacterium]|nr:hypothetical protein [Acidimicrobiales bacterium]
HNGSADAVSVSATPARTKRSGASPAGPYVSPGVGQHSGSDLSELFTRDGPIRKFFASTGTAITPGNVTHTGGTPLNGPDVTGADGVGTTTPGFIPFFGTSAASPNVAAIAALALQAKPTLTPAQLESAMKSSATDIEAAGIDPVAGNGIVMAPALMAAIGATPKANVQAGALTKTISPGDGDGAYEPGETVNLSQVLKNTGAASATGVTATLASPTSDAVVLTSSVSYPNIASGGGTASPTGGPLRFKIATTCACGSVLTVNITVHYTGGYAPTVVIPVKIPIGTPGPVTNVAYAGSPVAIPDANDTGATATVAVGSVGRIADLTFSIDGSSCTTAAASTTVGIDHTFISDLTVTLESPSGTEITLFSGIGDSGHNMCQAVFSDAAATPIQAKTASTDPPFTGTWKPATPLSLFDGEDPQGTWKVHAFDAYGEDTGSIRAFSLHIQTATCTIFTGSNSAPTSTVDTYRAVKNKVLTKSAALGVLANDTDSDGDTLTAVKVTNPSHGTVTLNANGGFTYTPTTDYLGADSFTYKPNDGTANGSTVAVDITVQTPTQAFVEQVFLDFVGRLADSGGLTFWTNRVDNGTETHASFAKQMARSHEYSVKVVTRAYLDVLGRATDPSGREYWANKVQHGLPISTLVLNLIGSNEYLTKSGGTVTGFVNATFQAILARPPTSAERTARVNAINGGTTRRQVALDLYNSTESKRRRTKVQFQLLLHRDPTTAEYTSWTSKLTTQSDADLAIAIAATNEYYVNAQNT